MTTITRTTLILRDIAWQTAAAIVQREVWGGPAYTAADLAFENRGDGWTVRLPGGAGAWEVHENVHLTDDELARVWTHAEAVAAKHGDDLVLGY